MAIPYLGCGATTHIVNDDSNFISTDENYKPDNHFIELTDGSRTNNVAKKRGTVDVDIVDENGTVRKARFEQHTLCPYSSLSNKHSWSFIVFRENFQGGRSY